MPKFKKLGLTESVTGTYGDKTKSYYAGRVRPGTVGGKSVLASALTTFADVQTAYGIVPGHCVVNPATGRKFELQNVTTNAPTVLGFNFDIVTGIWTFNGRITMTLPIGVHSYRGFDFDDTNANNIQIFVSSTVTTALCQGGTYGTWKVTLADFTPAGTTIFTANGSDQKGVYFHQQTGQLGLLHTGITSGGVAHGRAGNVLANKTKFFQQNGTAGAPVLYGWDSSLGNPSVAGAVTNGIESKTTAFAGTSPAAFFSMGASQNGYSQTANSAAAFESVVLFNGTTNIPSNFVASPFGSAQTQYFMRDLQLVSGVWYFNLATTSTGAAVTPAQNSATFSMARAGGITASHSILRTGTLTPALTGTILQAQSFGVATPTSVPASPALNGEDCLFLATSTNLYLVKISDIVDGSVNWASLSGVNLLGTLVDIVTPSAILARYSSYLDQWIYMTNTSKFVMKPHANNVITKVFGSLSTLYMEAQNRPSVPLGLSAILTMSVNAGWLFITGSTTGQRGVIACDLLSDSYFDQSYIISKVMQVPKGSKLRFFTTDEALADFTGDAVFFVRSADTFNDPIFDDPDTGWVEYSPYQDQAPASIGPFFNVKIAADLIRDNNTSAPQLHDVVVCYDEPGEIDDHFAWSAERTSDSAQSPMVVTVRQTRAFDTAPTKFILTGYDPEGNAAVTVDTAINQSAVQQSSNNGGSYTTWTNMAAFMSSFNSSSGTTELKFTITNPPVVDYLTWSLTYA